jgi:hypothetical protein
VSSSRCCARRWREERSLCRSRRRTGWSRRRGLDLPLLELLRQLSGGLRLPARPGAPERSCERRLGVILERAFPERRGRASDALDLRSLALALPRCRLVTCDAFMADLVRRSGLHVRFRSELFTGRRSDVLRLRDRLEQLAPNPS